MLGLLELLFVFLVGAVWAVFELRSVRRRPPSRPQAPRDDAPPEP